MLTSYLVSNAIILPLSGWFSTLIGRKRFYMICVALFTVSSLMCGLAPTLQLADLFPRAARAGGGGLQPSEQAILVERFARASSGMAMAMYGMGVVVAPAIGPTLGGWITDNYSWRWIFFINIPVGLLRSSSLTLLIYRSAVPKSRQKLRDGLRIDYIGLGLLALGLGSLQVVLDKGQRDDWFGSHFIVCVPLSAIGRSDRRGHLGIVATRTRSSISASSATATSPLATFLMFVLGFVLLSAPPCCCPVFLQTVLGYTASWAGWCLSPGGFAVMS